MNISIGSSSEQKKKYLIETLNDFGVVNFEIATYDVDSGISEQPVTSKETLAGSINRAIAAYDKNTNADFSIGVEVGYEPNESDDYEMFCWATIHDGANKFSCKSNNFLLPKFHQEKIKAGLYLGDFVRDFYADSDTLKKTLGRAIQKRDLIIKNAVTHVLLQFFNKGEY